MFKVIMHRNNMLIGVNAMSFSLNKETKTLSLYAENNTEEKIAVTSFTSIFIDGKLLYDAYSDQFHNFFY